MISLDWQFISEVRVQLRALCRLWFSTDTGGRSQQGTHTCFGSNPMDQAPGIQVLLYLTGRIASPLEPMLSHANLH
jgi:hypothetical protein